MGYQDSSFIMVTSNGGATWQDASHQKANRLNEVHFHDALNGWAVGIKDDMNCQYHSGDGGQSWTELPTIHVMNGELFGVHFRTSTAGHACGAEGAFFSTNNGGSSWAMNISIPSLGVDLHSLYHWGMFTGCAVGTAGTALYTTNNWSSYVETTTNTTESLYCVSGAPGADKLWAAGENGTIIYTSNYLFGWIGQPTGVTEHLNDIVMIDENNGWAVGDNGTILRYGIEASIYENDQMECLVYPIPSREVTNIEYELMNKKDVRMVLCDLFGRAVKIVLDEVQGPGNHVVQVNTGDLSPGIYSLMLFCGDLRTSRKLVVVE
jgi:photosystem II stability/assembly factor-like uncharacterized protein